MDELNSEILRQFENQGLTINEGVAIDARLVKSASRPLSNDQLKKIREQRHTPEAKLDKNGNTRKFSRDLDSDWVVQKDDPQSQKSTLYDHLQKQARRMVPPGLPGSILNFFSKTFRIESINYAKVYDMRGNLFNWAAL